LPYKKAVKPARFSRWTAFGSRLPQR